MLHYFINEIYYYIIDCNSDYNESKRNLDEYEKEHNYECRYINIIKLKDVLEENKKSTKEFNAALDDMLLIWNEFLKSKKIFNRLQ